jgi:hypothetical protein
LHPRPFVLDLVTAVIQRGNFSLGTPPGIEGKLPIELHEFCDFAALSLGLLHSIFSEHVQAALVPAALLSFSDTDRHCAMRARDVATA